MGKNNPMYGGLDKATAEQYRDEARERWGEVVDESWDRASKYSKADWEAIQAESKSINDGMADLVGGDPASREAQEWAGRWFGLINRSYYACTPEIFRGLGTMYVDDSRFTAFYENIEPGLAVFMRDAMHIYADNAEASAAAR